MVIIACIYLVLFLDVFYFYSVYAGISSMFFHFFDSHMRPYQDSIRPN